MIDFHTHIIPFIDDGAASVEESIEMTEILRRQNIQTAVCTPHFDPSHCSLEKFVLKRAAAVKQLEHCKITLILASETVLHEYLFYYSDLAALCIENTGYLLLELPFLGKWDEKQYAMLDQLITNYGVTPIIAHIERYCKKKKQEKQIRRLREMGCAIQLNTSSIQMKKSRHMVLRYIKEGYIDVLGSDCHNITTRPPVYADSCRVIVDELGTHYCNKLEEIAARIIRGDQIRENGILSGKLNKTEL